MRHRVAYRKLGRVTEHRMALLRNLAQELLRRERIETTVAKAKELRPFVERLITAAKRGIVAGSEGGRLLHARRLVARDLADRQVTRKLFETIAPRFVDRQGGYIRILRSRRRQGDDAELAQIELIGSEFEPSDAGDAESAAESTESADGVGGRLRRAAKRMRGGRSTKGGTGKTKESNESGSASE